MVVGRSAIFLFCFWHMIRLCEHEHRFVKIAWDVLAKCMVRWAALDHKELDTPWNLHLMLVSPIWDDCTYMCSTVDHEQVLSIWSFRSIELLFLIFGSLQICMLRVPFWSSQILMLFWFLQFGSLDLPFWFQSLKTNLNTFQHSKLCHSFWYEPFRKGAIGP